MSCGKLQEPRHAAPRTASGSADIPEQRFHPEARLEHRSDRSTLPANIIRSISMVLENVFPPATNLVMTIFF